MMINIEKLIFGSIFTLAIKRSNGVAERNFLSHWNNLKKQYFTHCFILFYK